MAKEIERKFLVRKEILNPILQDPKVIRTEISQFYLVSSKEVSVRLRRDAGNDGKVVITVKHGGNMISTNEHEFEIPPASYDERLGDRVGHEIVKTRHYVWHGDREWDVDVFGGALEGLVVAELECDDAAEVTDLPEWVGHEVTYDSRYKNAVLATSGKPATVDGHSAERIARVKAHNIAVMEALFSFGSENPEEEGPHHEPRLTDRLRSYSNDVHPLSEPKLRPYVYASEADPVLDVTGGELEALMFPSGDKAINPLKQKVAKPVPEVFDVGFLHPIGFLHDGILMPSAGLHSVGSDAVPAGGTPPHVANEGSAAAATQRVPDVHSAYADLAEELEALIAGSGTTSP